jgi:hypothetical protein
LKPFRNVSINAGEIANFAFPFQTRKQHPPAPASTQVSATAASSQPNQTTAAVVVPCCDDIPTTTHLTERSSSQQWIPMTDITGNNLKKVDPQTSQSCNQVNQQTSAVVVIAGDDRNIPGAIKKSMSDHHIPSPPVASNYSALLSAGASGATVAADHEATGSMGKDCGPLDDYLWLCIQSCWAECPEDRPDFRLIRARLSPLRAGM